MISLRTNSSFLMMKLYDQKSSLAFDVSLAAVIKKAEPSDTLACG